MATVNSGGMPGRSKTEFLRMVREALGKDEGPPEQPYHRLVEDLDTLEERAAELESRLRANRPQLLDRFAEMAAKGGWNVHRVLGAEAAIGRIDAIIGEVGATRIVRSGQSVFDAVPVDTALEWRGIDLVPVVRDGSTSREELREKMRHADVGLTGTDYALAETGSLVILPRQGLSRLVSLVPPVHVALVRPEEVLESLHDLFLLRRLEYKRRGGEMGSYLNFITGPSRTADIEQTLVVGVHGPKEVHLVLLG
jgi:L-lactate dehydrogenase complex protein LldG